MTIEARCPTCEHSYNVPDSQRGKRVKCRNCADIFTVVVSAAEPDVETPDRGERTDRAERTERPERSESRRERESPVRERRDDDDEKPRKKKKGNDDSTVLPVLLILGGVFLLIFLGGGLAIWVATSRRPANFNDNANDFFGNAPNQVDIFPNPGQVRDPNAQPANIDEALRDIREQFDNPWTPKARAEWLANQPIDAARRNAVCEALWDIWKRNGHHFNKEAAVVAFCKWAGDDQAARLCELTEAGKGDAMDALARVKPPGAAAALCKRLNDWGSRGKVFKSLETLGAQHAEKEVLKLVTHPDDHLRAEASRLILKWGTRHELLLDQLIADAGGTNPEQARRALEQLSKYPLDGAKQAGAVKAIKQYLSTGNTDPTAAVQAAQRWGPAEVSAELSADLDRPARRAEHAKILDVLNRINHETGRQAILRVYFGKGPANEKAIAERLVRENAAAFEPQMLELLKGTDDMDRCKSVLALLETAGTPASLTVLKELGDAMPNLKVSADKTARAIRVRQPGRGAFDVPANLNAALDDIRDHPDNPFIPKARAEWLVGQPIVEARRKEVCATLWELFQKSQHHFVKESAAIAFCKWAGPEQGEQLLELAAKGRAEAQATLVRGQNVKVAAVLCQQLPNFLARGNAVRQLESLGAAQAEKEVVKYLNHADPGVRMDVDKLLKKWNTKTSVIIDQLLVDLRDANHLVARAALDNLAKMPVEADRQAVVVKALKELFAIPNPVLLASAANVAATWGTAELTPELVLALNNPAFGIDRNRILETLVSINTEASRQAVVQQLGTTLRQAAANAIIKGGSDFEPQVLDHLKQVADPLQRRSALTLLQKIGTPAGIPAIRAVAEKDPLLTPFIDRVVQDIQNRAKP